MAKEPSELPSIPQLFSIPDIWFDVIARLLPGAIFVVSVRSLLLTDMSTPDAVGFLALMACAYMIGFFVCPLSSRVAMLMEQRIAKRKGEKANYVQERQHKLGRESRDSMILSKMGGEVVFFLQCIWFSLLFLSMFSYFPNKSASLIWWMPLVIAALSTGFAIEVADRRFERAKNIPGGGSSSAQES